MPKPVLAAGHLWKKNQIILFAGAIEGFTLAIGLNTIRVNKNSNRILGILSGIWGLVFLIFACQPRAFI
jgi:uncharacterized membrane protein